MLSHRSHLWVVEMRRRAAGSAPERPLVAAPLYHMNALAVSQAALGQGDAIILLPGFTAASYISGPGRVVASAGPTAGATACSRAA